MHDVMFYEAFSEEEQAIRRYLPAGCRAGFSAQTIQAAGAAEPPAPLISIRTQSVVPTNWHPQVRGLLARTTGYDHLRPFLLLDRPPALACLPEYCSRAVAEQAALLWLALLRRLPAQLAQWATFNRDGLTGGECAGRTLAVVGVGRIGHEIAQIGRGLGLKVVGVDPVPRHPDVTYRPWPEAAAQADILVASMDLNETNRQFFNRTNVEGNCRPHALLINVARGELVNTADVLALLDERKLGGLAMDVYAEETRIADALRDAGEGGPELALLQQLARHPNVLLTPHNAFNTQEAVDRKSEYSVQQVVHFLQHGQFRWPWLG